MKISSQNLIQPSQNSLSSHRQPSPALNTNTDLKLAEKNDSALKSSEVTNSHALSSQGVMAVSTSQSSLPLGERATAFLQGEEGKVFLSADKLEQMSDVLKRLSKEQQIALIDSDIISNDDFLSVAKNLDDRQIRQFSEIANALNTPPERSLLLNNHTPSAKVRAFVETLVALDNETQSKVLDRAHLEVQKVLPSEPRDSYDKFGLNATPSASANDLNNFLDVINASEDVKATLEDLTLFSEEQQSNLLTVMAGSPFAENIVAQLKDQPDSLKTDLLSFMSNTVSNVTAQDVPKGIGWQGWLGATTLDHDENTAKTANKMIEQTLSLIETYDFSTQQLQEMASRLNTFSVAEQRAYLTISEEGFALLIGEGNESKTKLSLKGAEEAITAIDNVRGNYQARDLVYKSRMGEAGSVANNSLMYDIKNDSAEISDQRNMVESLVADAYFSLKNINLAAIEPDDKNKNETPVYTEHTNTLATNLLTLDSDTRDQLSASLSRLATSAVPLAQLDDDSLSMALSPLYQRSAALAETNDIKALMSVQQQVISDDKLVSEQQFWQSVESAGTQIDDFIQTLKGQDNAVQQVIIEFFVQNNSTHIENETEKNEMEGNKQDFFSLLDTAS